MRGSCARLVRCTRPAPSVCRNLPFSHTNQIGVRCGYPSARCVAMRAMILRFRYSSISAWLRAFSGVAVDLLLMGPPLGFRPTLPCAAGYAQANVRHFSWSVPMAPRFGIFLSAQHPPAMTASQIARDCCEQVRLARELGFED